MNYNTFGKNSGAGSLSTDKKYNFGTYGQNRKYSDTSQYGFTQNFDIPNNFSLLSNNDNKNTFGLTSTATGNTKNSSGSSIAGASIKDTILSVSGNEKTKNLLSQINDDVLEEYYKLTQEADDIAKLQGVYSPYGDHYSSAKAAANFFYDKGDKEAEKYFDTVARSNSSDGNISKGNTYLGYSSRSNTSSGNTSRTTTNNHSTSVAIDDDIMLLNDINLDFSTTLDVQKTIDDYNAQNKPKQEIKYTNEKKDTAPQAPVSHPEKITKVTDFSKEKTESGIVVEEAAYLVLDLMGYNSAVIDKKENTDWLDLPVGYSLYHKRDDNGAKIPLTDDELYMVDKLTYWKKVDKYKFEGLDIAVYSKTINGKKHIVVVNSGSENLSKITERTGEVVYDWVDNAARFVGDTDDVEKSIEYAKKIVKKYPDAVITFVGYSKGGAEAAANAMATGKDAVLFNPAVLRYSNRYGIGDEYDGNMVSYIVSGEILSKTDGLIHNNLPGEKKYIGEDFDLWNNIFDIYKDFYSNLDTWEYSKSLESFNALKKEFDKSIDLHILENLISIGNGGK